MLAPRFLQPVRIAGRRALTPLHSSSDVGIRRLHPSPVESAPFSSFRWRAAETSPVSHSQPPESTESANIAASPESSSTTPKPTSALEAEIAQQKKEITDLKDRYLRSRADFINLQERTKREVTAAKLYAINAFAKDLIESVDNLERALGTVTPATRSGEQTTEERIKSPDQQAASARQETVNLYNGLKMTETVLMQTLKKHGLERIDPAVDGEKFDPVKHEALFQQPVEGKEDGTVFHTQQKGFILNGRTLRAAKVGIVQGAS